MKPLQGLAGMCLVGIIFACIAVLSTAPDALLHAQTVEGKESHVSISWEEFKELVKMDADEVKLTWEEFKKLLAQTGSEVKVEYDIENGMVVLKREQFRKLLERMKPPDITAVQPPGDYLITKSEYAGIMSKSSTTFRTKFFLEIFEKERTTYPKVQLLPQSVALRDIKLDGKPALVMIESGWYVLTTEEPGQHIVELEFSVQSDLDKGPQVLNLTVPQTAITLFKLDIPVPDVTVEIPQEKQMSLMRAAGYTRVEAVLSTTNQINVTIHRAIVVKEAKEKGPAKIYAETFDLLSIDDDALRVTSRIKLNVLQNAIAEVAVRVPDGYSVLYVKDQTWQEVRGWHLEKEDNAELLTVPFGGQREGAIFFTVIAEKVFPKENEEIGYKGFEVLKAIRQTGYVGAEKKSTAEAEISQIDNIDRIDIQELPFDLLNLSARPLIFGLRYLHHPYRVSLKITKHKDLPVVNTVIDHASLVSVFMEEGKIVSRVVYTMRNTGMQFLELELPKDAEIWSLYVDGQREIPSKNEQGAFMIPLARSRIEGESIASFDVEILYFYKLKRFAFFGSNRLEFPKTNVIISKMLWSCYLPEDYRFIHFGGNVEKEKLATGINPFLGKTRVFSYDDVSGYNRALENWENPEAAAADKDIRRAQRVLESEFRTSALNAPADFHRQVREEVNFAQNIEEEQGKGLILGSDAGKALLKIEIPTTGQLYRFAKTIVEEEDLFINFQYVGRWMNILIRIIFLLIIGIILYLVRRKLRALFIRLRHSALAHRASWNRVLSPAGARIIFAIAALICLFLSKFLFVVFVLLFLLVCIKPEWLFRRKQNVSEQQSPNRQT
jgi:hypothetical protein